MEFKNQTELKEFRERVRQLYVVMNNLSKVWDSEAYKILNVLLQNLCSTESNDKMDQIIVSIRLFSEYRGKHCYISTFVLNEIDMIIESIYSEY